MNNITHIGQMGADEQTSAGFWLFQITPTDFDNAYESLRQYLKNELGFVDEYTYLGVLGGTLKDFLNNYINASHAIGAAYHSYNKNKFYNYLKTNYGYDDDELDIYLPALSIVNDQGKIPRSIYDAYSYTPSSESAVVEAGKSVITWGVGLGAAYLIGYLLLREAVFGRTKKSRK